MTPRKSPWRARVNDEDEARFERAARVLGFARGGDVNQSAFLKAGANALVLRAARRRIDDLGGLAAAVQANARGLRALLVDAVIAAHGDEVALRHALGVGLTVDAETWGEALARYPEVARAMTAERAKAGRGE